MAAPGKYLLGDERPPTPPAIERLFFGEREPPPGAQAGAPPERISLPPHFFPPIGAQFFYPFGSATVAGPNASWAVPASLQLNVPAAFVAVVRSLGVAVLNMLATSDIQVVLRVAGGALAPVRRLPAQPVAYVEREWDSVAYLVPGPSRIDMLATVVDGGTYPITAYYEGWLLPADAWAVYTGKGA